jgi:hypothetical protein
MIGNSLALKSLEQLVEKDLHDRGIALEKARIIFNGDFNWFNGTDRQSFVSLNNRVMKMVDDQKAFCTAGNIEAELAIKINDAAESSGCGCSYPEYVSDKVVANSDKIMANFMKITAGTDVERGKKVRAILINDLLCLHYDVPCLMY